MRLKEKYQKEVIPALKQELGLKNSLAVPRLDKVVINVGLSPDLKAENYLSNVENTLRQISGQKPQPTQARQSIAGFKTRQGQTIGMKVTLRGMRMFDFADKLVNVALPRIRDFRGLDPKAIDNQGNLSIGFRENLAFPEINPDAVDMIHGLEVTITTTAKDKETGLRLFKLLGFPFKKN